MSPVRRVVYLLIIAAFLTSIHWSPTYEVLFNNVFFKGLDGMGERYVDDSLTRATATFALARAANAFISFLQESQVQATLFGAGVSLAVGQILDPVNDLIERFSWVMLASMTSLGVQKFFISFGAWLSIRVMLSLALFFLLGGLCPPFRWTRHLWTTGGRLIIITIMIRLFIPLAGWASQEVYELFLEKTYEESIVRLDVEEFKGPTASESDFWKNLQNMKLREKIDVLKDRMSELTAYLVNLMVVFSIQNILLPLITAWLFLKMLRYLSVTGFDFNQPFIGGPPRT